MQGIPDQSHWPKLGGGTLPYCPLGLITKLLIWPYYNDRGEKWVNLLWSIQNTQKESNCIDKCYQKVYLSSCLVCQFPKQWLMLCHYFSVLLMRRYSLFKLALHLAFAWFSFGTGHNGFFPFSSETLEWRSRKTFVITRNDTITCLFLYFKYITTTFTYFVTLHGAYSTEYVVCQSTW